MARSPHRMWPSSSGLRLWARLGLVATLSFAGAACAGSTSNKGADDADEDDDRVGGDADKGGTRLRSGRSATSVTVRYEVTAKANWERGQTEYEDENWLAAQKYFSYIRSKFPYSAYASRAEIRIADCLFQRGRNLEAIDGYQNFIRLHPTHRKVSYAMLMTGKAYHKQIPTDFFMLPPSHEKDQAAVRDAAHALGAYVKRFPNDERVEEGKELLEDARKRLMAHERYVADFYKDRDKQRAYVGRLEVIRTRFADVGLTDELLFEIVEAYLEIGELDKAKNAAREIDAKFPDSDRRVRAAQLIDVAISRGVGKKKVEEKPEPVRESAGSQPTGG